MQGSEKGERHLIFQDLEFTGLVSGTTPISIGAVDSDGRTFYAEFTDYDESMVDDWVRDNVASRLRLGRRTVRRGGIFLDLVTVTVGEPREDADVSFLGTREEVAGAYEEWVGGILREVGRTKAEIWMDLGHYDWVTFCGMWGGALSIPDVLYYIPMDLCTMLRLAGEDPDADREAMAGVPRDGKHDALHDARVLREIHARLRGRFPGK